MSIDILGTSWVQCWSMLQYSFMSTETRRLIRTDSPGRPPRLSHITWTTSEYMYIVTIVLVSSIYQVHSSRFCCLSLLTSTLLFFTSVVKRKTSISNTLQDTNVCDIKLRLNMRLRMWAAHTVDALDLCTIFQWHSFITKNHPLLECCISKFKGQKLNIYI